MGLLDLFIAATIPVLKVLLVTGLGSLLALDSINILGEDARKHLNNIVFFVFNPAFVYSNLSGTITYESLIELWFMPVNILITFIIGSVLGWVVVRITRPPSDLQGLIIGCCAAGNLGNLLLIIIPAVCKEKGSPFGDPDVCHTYGLAYASLSMAVGAVYLWSYVYNIVRICSKKHLEEAEINAIKSPRETSAPQVGSCEEPLLSSKDFTISEGIADHILPCSKFDGNVQVTISDQIKKHLRVVLKKINLKGLLAPSTTGAIFGFIVGIVPVFRWSLIGDAAPLRVIQDSASFLGDGAIPALTLIMGGNLLRGLKGSGIQKFAIVGIIVARYIVLPLTGILVVKGAVHFGLVPENPLYQFILLLQFALPPAMNIGTITQLFGAGESECSVIMLWTYVLASISLTFWSTFFMWFVARYH